MNKNVYIILFLCSICHTMALQGKQKDYFQKIKDFFSRPMKEKVDQFEYDATSIESLSITNSNGNIDVQTGPKKSLFIKTIARAYKQDDLAMVTIAIDEHKKNHLKVITQCSNKKRKRIPVNYQVIIPESMNVALRITDRGDLSIKNVQGTIDAVANDNIAITNTKNPVIAQTRKKGSISIFQSCGPVEAHSYAGNITGKNIAHTLYADSTKGTISIACKNIPSTASLDLTSAAGNIILALPSETNAHIRGQTTHGILMSDHPVTLNSYTTQLNKLAWNKFKKEVDGVIGSGKATIELRSTSGNIKIIETKTT